MNPLDPAALQGLGSNPLFLAGLQILSNNQRSPQYTPLFQGVPQAFAAANQNAYLMSQMQRQQAEDARRQKELERLDAERQKRDQFFSGIATSAQAPYVAAGGPNPMSPSDWATKLQQSGIPELALKGIEMQTQPQDLVDIMGPNGPIKVPKNQAIGQAPVIPSMLPKTPEQMRQDEDLAKLRSGGSTPYYTYQPITDSTGAVTGIARLDARGGPPSRVEIPGLGPVMRPQDNPAVQGSIASAKAGGKVTGETTATAKVNLPNIEAAADQTIKLVKELRDHPGMPDVVGLPNLLTGGGRLWGSKGAGFRTRLQQIQGKQFLQAYETLKGGGQITEVEGLKAEQAIARMQTAQSEVDFKQAANEFIATIEAAKQRAKARAGMAGAGGDNPGGGSFDYVPGQGLVPR